MSCPSPFEKFEIESTLTGSSRDRLGSTGSTGSTTHSSGSKTASAKGSSGIDIKIDWLVRTIKEMKNETACKKEIKMMIKKVVREEMGNIKQELEDLKRMMQGGAYGGVQRAYSEAVKEKKKENVIIIKQSAAKK